MPLISAVTVVLARITSISFAFRGSSASLFFASVSIKKEVLSPSLGWETSASGSSLSGPQEPGRLYSLHTDIQGQLVGKRWGKECVFQALLPKQSTLHSPSLPEVASLFGGSEHWPRDFPGDPVLKNPPYNAGDEGSIPGQGTKILHAAVQLSRRIKTTEPTHPGACAPQLEKRKPTCHN